MTHTFATCDRPWWKRPPTWFIALAIVLLTGFLVFELGGRASPVTPYGTFLDQLDAGNVASVTFEGTEISGRLKSPVGGAAENGAAQRDAFRSRVPDFGDPALIPELRKQRVAIDVATPSPWTWLLGRVPWPMLAIVGVMLVAALARILRGGPVLPGPGGPAMPAHGMGPFGLLASLFAKERTATGAATQEGDQPKSR
jgi:ATP-dependent Zn protease